MDNTALGIVIAVLFAALLTCFCMIIIRIYFRKIKTYTRLIYEKELQTQKAVNEAIHETQEQVLNDISQDLHDDAGQQLTYINFQLEHLKLDSPELTTVLNPVSESVSRLAESVRSISHSLNNRLLLQDDLFKAIRSEAGRIHKSNPTTVTTTIKKTPSREFSNNEKIIIYRIFQEAINNALKHAKAKKIIVELAASPFSMTITDDGIGFEPLASGKNSLGLSGMTRRANIVGFTIAIASASGKGTTIRLTETTHGKDEHLPD